MLFAGRIFSADALRGLWRPSHKTQYNSETVTLSIYFASPIDAVSSLMVAAAPSGGPEAYYENGSQDGSRPGVFYVNLNPLESQKKYEAVTLTLHEGNPGHNYQFVFNKQQKDLPRFMAKLM